MTAILNKRTAKQYVNQLKAISVVAKDIKKQVACYNANLKALNECHPTTLSDLDYKKGCKKSVKELAAKIWLLKLAYKLLQRGASFLHAGNEMDHTLRMNSIVWNRKEKVKKVHVYLFEEAAANYIAAKVKKVLLTTATKPPIKTKYFMGQPLVKDLTGNSTEVKNLSKNK